MNTETNTQNSKAEAEPFAYEIIKNPYEQMHYVHLTDELITHFDGTPGQQQYDIAIGLDSSIRPAFKLLRELYPTLAARDADGNTKPTPELLFLNIDGRQNKDMSEAGIQGLRDVLTDPETKQNKLAGKRVLIVDEIAVSGDTLNNAARYLQEAIPEAEFGTYAWMNARTAISSALPTNNVRWYERDNDRFRLVGHPVVDDPQRQWVSNPLPGGMTPLRQQLYAEMKQLASDLVDGKIAYWPADSRPDHEERIQQHNGVSVAAFYKYRSWLQQHTWPDYHLGGAIGAEDEPLPDTEAKLHLQEAARARTTTNSGRRSSAHRTYEREEIPEESMKLVARSLGRTALPADQRGIFR